MPAPDTTIVLHCFNEAWALRDTLKALRLQELTGWELIAFDSGSTDGSAELLRAARPRHLIELLPRDYRPGHVLNLGMELATTGRVIFLNADATPQGPHWLRPLVDALREPTVAAVFGRQIPRPDCQAVFAADYERCFGERRESAHWDHFFSMVSSGLRKDIWLERGFLETMQYSEDDEYTRWCRSRGYRIVYQPESVVVHSHNYTPRQAYKRSFGEAWALAAVWSGTPRRITSSSRLLLGWMNDLRKDFAFCHRARRFGEWPHAARIRWQQRLGRRDGFRAGWGMHGGSLASSAAGGPGRPTPNGMAPDAACNPA
jgi:rhamnosyltransferase